VAQPPDPPRRGHPDSEITHPDPVGTTLTCGDIPGGDAGTQNRIIGICGRKPGSLIRAIGIRSEGIKELEFAR